MFGSVEKSSSRFESILISKHSTEEMNFPSEGSDSRRPLASDPILEMENSDIVLRYECFPLSYQTSVRQYTLTKLSAMAFTHLDHLCDSVLKVCCACSLSSP